MRKLLAATAIGGALLVGTMLGTGTASADNYQDMSFLALLESHGIQGNELGIPWAYGVCRDIDTRLAEGHSIDYALAYSVDSVYDNTPANFSLESSQWFVATSVVVYCPWNDPTGSSDNRGFLA